MTDQFDAELKARFDELKAGDAAQAPPFQLPDPGLVIPSRRIRIPLPLAIAAGALLAAGATLGYLSLRRTPLPDVSGIVAWRAPTDFLLRRPGGYRLSGSVIDRFIPTTALYPGDQR